MQQTASLDQRCVYEAGLLEAAELENEVARRSRGN
jgi:hypothetical protein